MLANNMLQIRGLEYPLTSHEKIGALRTQC
jgi:hypothetical protein